VFVISRKEDNFGEGRERISTAWTLIQLEGMHCEIQQHIL